MACSGVCALRRASRRPLRRQGAAASASTSSPSTGSSIGASALPASADRRRPRSGDFRGDVVERHLQRFVAGGGEVAEVGFGGRAGDLDCDASARTASSAPRAVRTLLLDSADCLELVDARVALATSVAQRGDRPIRPGRAAAGSRRTLFRSRRRCRFARAPRRVAAMRASSSRDASSSGGRRRRAPTRARRARRRRPWPRRRRRLAAPFPRVARRSRRWRRKRCSATSRSPASPRSTRASSARTSSRRRSSS